MNCCFARCAAKSGSCTLVLGVVDCFPAALLVESHVRQLLYDWLVNLGFWRRRENFYQQNSTRFTKYNDHLIDCSPLRGFPTPEVGTICKDLAMSPCRWHQALAKRHSQLGGIVWPPGRVTFDFVTWLELGEPFGQGFTLYLIADILWQTKLPGKKTLSFNIYYDETNCREKLVFLFSKSLWKFPLVGWNCHRTTLKSCWTNKLIFDV